MTTTVVKSELHRGEFSALKTSAEDDNEEAGGALEVDIEGIAGGTLRFDEEPLPKGGKSSWLTGEEVEAPLITLCIPLMNREELAIIRSDRAHAEKEEIKRKSSGIERRTRNSRDFEHDFRKIRLFPKQFPQRKSPPIHPKIALGTAPTTWPP